MSTNPTIKRILAFVMACALMLCGAQALADQVYTQKAAAVYGQPGDGAQQIGTLKAGTEVTVAAEKGGWAMLKKGSAVAYVKSSDLIKVESTGTIAAYTASAAPMYKAFSTASKKLGTIPAGSAVTITAKAGSMAYVKYGKYKGFVELANLTDKAPAKAAAAEPAKAETPAVSKTVYVAKDGAKVYNAKGKAIGKLPLNTELTLTAVKNGVCQVRAGGKTAYMLQGDLSESRTAPEPAAQQVEQPETLCASAYVNKDGAKVYNAKGREIGAAPLNTAVTVTAVKGSVCRVTCGGKTAYMLKGDLSCEKVQAAPAQTAQAEAAAVQAYANKDGAKVYDASGKELGSLSLNASVTVTAVNGDLCQVSSGGKTAYMKKADLSASKTEAPKAETAAAPTGASTVTPARGTAKEMDWWTSDIQKIFARGTTAQITDVATGISWREQRRGGTNHADVQPLTAADTAAMKKACGSWSWSRRAIIVTINGVNYAASMNCMPHGGGSITDNNFNGHHCIHFTNSRTHGGNKVCPLHQAAIKKAAAANL